VALRGSGTKPGESHRATVYFEETRELKKKNKTEEGKEEDFPKIELHTFNSRDERVECYQSGKRGTSKDVSLAQPSGRERDTLGKRGGMKAGKTASFTDRSVPPEERGRIR